LWPLGDTADTAIAHPFIPGYNKSRENLEGIASLISETRWREINILPSHHLGREKYQLLGKEYKAAFLPTHSSEDLEAAKAIYEECGVTCFIGQHTPF